MGTATLSQPDPLGPALAGNLACGAWTLEQLWEGWGAGPQRKTDGIQAEASFVCTCSPAGACTPTAPEFAVGRGCGEKVQPGPSGLTLPWFQFLLFLLII